MGRITSSVGLISGVPIAETVEQLISISARPRDLLVQRTEKLRAEQVAITELTALIVGLEFSMQNLGRSSLFSERTVASSNEKLLTATTSGNPRLGSFRFTPVQQAQSHQLLSSGVASKDEALGGGEVSFRFGGFVDRGISLDELNDGEGVERGKLRITDRSGASEIIDLRFARTIDDVIAAINQAENINVSASAAGDRLKLTDNTGQATANLQVREVSSGRTAADLGLAGINVAAEEATGSDILRLYDALALARLNDGNGVDLRSGVADLEVSLQDGSTLQIEFLAQTKGDTQATATTEAANGVDAQVKFTSLGLGAAFDGYQIRFEDDADIAVGNETVAINTAAKTLTFKIDAGNTRAVDIVAALNADATASDFFTASVAEGGDGTGLISVSDAAETAGGATETRNETTLGDILETINLADPARLQARLSASGDRIELVDLTSGSGTFAASSLFGGTVAEQLGLKKAANGNVISGERRFAGLKTALLDSLAGGSGLGTLGLLDLTDRGGASAAVDLSSAESLSDVIEAINAAGIGVSAEINQSRNGLALKDTSGGSGNLIAANGDGTNTADLLRIAVDEAVALKSSGSLDLRTLNRQTRLSSFNNGRGVDDGSILITDTDGKSAALNFAVSKPETLGDVIDLINGLGIGVSARINNSGDGLLLVDIASGSGTLTVKDEGAGTVAKDLHLAISATEVNLNGTPTQVIDGSTTIKVTLEEDDSLQDLVDKINALEADVAASVFNAGSGATPVRLALGSGIAGGEGALLVDASQLGLSFRETAAARDALLVVGSASGSVAAAIVSSPTNTFSDVVDGVSLTIHEASSEEVEIGVQQTDQPLVTQLELFVEQYNKLQTKLDELTFFNAEDNTKGMLFGSTETLRVQSDLSRLLTTRLHGLGAVSSLEELGLSLDDQGKLKLDAKQLRGRLATSAEDVERFFTDAERGVSARFTNLTGQLAGVGNSVLVGRSASLQTSIDGNLQRILDLSAKLERERESLTNKFFRLEESLSRLQSNLSAIQQIQILPPLFSQG